MFGFTKLVGVLLWDVGDMCIAIKLCEHIVSLCYYIHKFVSDRLKHINNDTNTLMDDNIHITRNELDAQSQKSKNLSQKLDEDIHLLMEAKQKE